MFWIRIEKSKFMVLAAVVAVVVVAGVVVSNSGIMPSQGYVAPIEQAVNGANVDSDAEPLNQEAAAPTESGKGNEMVVVDEKPSENTPDMSGEQMAGNGHAMMTDVRHTVNMGSDGFDPKQITIRQGDTVEFVVTGSRDYWPASDIHPSHTLYPGTSISDCGEGKDMFDSCGKLKNGEKFSFTFHEKGEWKYHDHLSPSKEGTVTVE